MEDSTVSETDESPLPPDLKKILGVEARPAARRKVALSRSQKALIAVVVAGAVLIAGLGFWGSYAAVSALAAQKHFGQFSRWFPIGIDAGIAVLLSLDMVLAGLRIPFPLLRQFAWVLTAATISFNAATAEGDWLAIAMHAIIPMLFIVIIEGARHTIGRIADITADQVKESPPFSRWILAPWPTFRIWRRMRMWEITSYDHAVALERDTHVLRTRLRQRHGWRWRTAASERAHLALNLSRYGVPVWDTLTRELPDIEPDIRPADTPAPAPGKAGQPTPDNPGTTVPTSADTPDTPQSDKPADTVPDSNVVPMSAPRPSRRTARPPARTAATGQGGESLSGHVRDSIANGITDTDTILATARDKFGHDTKRETVRRLVNRHAPDNDADPEDREPLTGS
jgi:hypothetical protein